MFSPGLYWEMRTEHRLCKEGFVNLNDFGGVRMWGIICGICRINTWFYTEYLLFETSFDVSLNCVFYFLTNDSEGVGGIIICRWSQTEPVNVYLRATMMQKIINLTVTDVRFPTSLEQHGSDAMVRSFCTNIDMTGFRSSLKPGLSVPFSVHTAAHGPGLFSSVRGSGHGQRAERFWFYLHFRERKRDW